MVLILPEKAVSGNNSIHEKNQKLTKQPKQITKLKN
jgi:hypothetical protein